MPNSIVFSTANLSLAKSNLGFDSCTLALCKSTVSSRVRVRCAAEDDAFYIRRCVELARTAIGCTSPNPMVGCVIVKDGKIVGEGFHPKAGQPHAEVFALKDAGVLAENATAYVSLEPCNHYGRTPPCTEALINAKVKHVVVGMVDPNPIVASKGVERLRDSGIGVTVGVEEMLCRKLNEAYIHRMLTGRPFVTLRYTLSFNGSITNRLGKGADEPGGYFSQLMQEHDGIIIPSDQLTKISTLPTSHEIGANQPFHVVIANGVSSSLQLPGFITKFASKIIVLADNEVKIQPEMQGVEVVILENITLSSILDYCGKRGMCSILLDFRGHSKSLSELLEGVLVENLVQKVVMEILPFWCISDEYSSLPSGWKSLRLENLKSRTLSESVLVEGYI
ncbi:riboflavin biosynthesis protein PYRD, chloroplastic [Curcuma longa]|uniref:riboflavin biosynthesis protein PYRD, chloroplastic n=1 Tax=Curcuma longa TaxID=136217 RepID=UPI003D9F4E7D